MRLGGFYSVQDITELDLICPKLDAHGLSVIPAPYQLHRMSDDQCWEFGERAQELDIVIGEAGMWDNLMTTDRHVQEERILLVRTLLQKADKMRCKTVVTLVGSSVDTNPPLTPHPDNYSRKFKNAFRDVVLRILDKLDLRYTKYSIEPWHNTFFYQPEEIYNFIRQVDHPLLAFHLDQMNMISQQNYFKTTGLIENTFKFLGDYISSVHLKDLRCDPSYMFLKYDEVLIGEGVLDYITLLKHLSSLSTDLPCFCEHLQSEQEYLINFSRLHELAKNAGVEFRRRIPGSHLI